MASQMYTYLTPLTLLIYLVTFVLPFLYVYSYAYGIFKTVLLVFKHYMYYIHFLTLIVILTLAVKFYLHYATYS